MSQIYTSELTSIWLPILHNFPVQSTQFTSCEQFWDYLGVGAIKWGDHFASQLFIHIWSTGSHWQWWRLHQLCVPMLCKLLWGKMMCQLTATAYTFVSQFNSAIEILWWLPTILHHPRQWIQVVHNKDSTSVSTYSSVFIVKPIEW